MELKEKILKSLPLKGERGNKKRATDYWVFVKQDRDHEVYRHEVADVLVQNIGASFSHWRAQEPADVEVWAFMIEGRLTAGVRLTDISFRQRKYRAGERPGALRPPLAAALVVMSDPSPEDRFIDPMCGTGTILCERALWGATESLVGGDIDHEAIEIARQSAKIIDRPVELYRWDATDEEALIENAAGATVLVCNLPFGKRFESSDLRSLYKRALKAWRASLAAGARMILLTSERDILRSAALDVGLKARTLTVLTTQGLRATVFEVRNGKG